MAANYSVEKTDRGYALTVDGQYKGTFGSEAQAERARMARM